MSGLGAAWREKIEDPIIQEILEFAKKQGLDLSVVKGRMRPWGIQVEELVDPRYVKKIAQVLKDAGEWPDGMPLVVVADGVLSWVMDGSHRTTAARAAELPWIPVLLANADTYLAISTEFGIPLFDYVHSILPSVDPLMEENERKDEEGGRPKKRTVEAWDMEAFQSPEMGVPRLGSRGERRVPKGYLYHSTFADRIFSISRFGLLPSETPRWSGKLGEWSIGKIFFSGHVSAAAFYAANHFARELFRHGESPDPVLLRVDSKSLADVHRDTYSWDDWFVERAVPPDQIEVWIPWDETWAPLKSVSREVSRMETVRGESGDLKIDPKAGAHVYTEAYFKKFWPMDEGIS